MIYNIIYNNINVTINESDSNPYIEFDDTVFTSNKRRFKILAFTCDYKSQTLKVEWANQLIDKSSDKEITSYSAKKINNHFYFQGFYNHVPSIPIGIVATRACLNNLLENLQSYFTDSIYCFKNTHDYKFFHPIQLKTELSTTSIDTGDLDLIGQKIFKTKIELIAIVCNPNNEDIYNYSLNDSVYQESNIFDVTLLQKPFKVKVKNITESESLGFDITSSITIK